jgi:hypothetical protein
MADGRSHRLRDSIEAGAHTMTAADPLPTDLRSLARLSVWSHKAQMGTP